MKRLCIIIICIFLLPITYAQSLYKFDLGDEFSNVAEGYTPVSLTESYDPAIGFGWVDNPEATFDQLSGPLIDDVLIDGVKSHKTCSFQIDIPKGEYVLNLVGGSIDQAISSFQVKVNGQLIRDTIQSPFFRLPYRHFHHKIAVTSNSLNIAFIPLSDTIVIHAIELHPVTRPFSIPQLDPQSLETDTAIVGNYYRELIQKQKDNPEDIHIKLQKELLGRYLKAVYYYDIGWWSWAVEETGLSVFDRFHAASDWLEELLTYPDHPLHDRAIYLIARIHYWLYKEQGDENNTIRSQKFFQMLSTKYPDHDNLAMYTGTNIPYAITNDIDSLGAPAWAIMQQEAISRMLHIIHWWVDSVQAENGELGGKFGDDVEILRWWLPAVLGADDNKARIGYQRLADGVWNSGKLEQGYSKKLEDVEHAAELIRDSHPVMLILKYGDPEYVERCMQGMQHLETLWTGKTPKGNRHFKSAYFSATEILTQPPYGVDVPMNARATLTGLWATWYNQNPQLVKLFTEWGHAWAKAAASTEKGKPEWILPAAVRFDNNEIGGYSNNWYHPDLGWEYYRWEHIGGIEEMYHQMLGMYNITGDSTLLVPYTNMLDITHHYAMQGTTAKSVIGSEAWAASHLLSEPDLLGYALNLGLNEYTTLVQDKGSYYARYLIDQDIEIVEQGLDYILQSLKYNLPLFTTEVKFTDRVYVPGHDLLSGMYTGHVGSGFEYPFLHVSWENTLNEVGILVGNCNDTTLQVSIHNFVDTKELGMKVWRLTNGTYSLSIRDLNNPSSGMEHEITIDERGQYVPILLPQTGTYSVSMELIEKHSPTLFPRGDLALGDISVEILNTDEEIVTANLTVNIHNIGNLAMDDITIKLSSGEEILAERKIDGIAAPNDLFPVKEVLNFSDLHIPFTNNTVQVSIGSVKDGQKEKEITYTNNMRVVDLSRYKH